MDQMNFTHNGIGIMVVEIGPRRFAVSARRENEPGYQIEFGDGDAIEAHVTNGPKLDARAVFGEAVDGLREAFGRVVLASRVRAAAAFECGGAKYLVRRVDMLASIYPADSSQAGGFDLSPVLLNAVCSIDDTGLRIAGGSWGGRLGAVTDRAGLYAAAAKALSS